MGDERAKYLTAGGAPTMASKPAFTLTEDELSGLVARAVGDALASTPPLSARLLDRVQLAVALSCSAATVDKLRRQGMPCLYLGDSPRFEVEDCVAWLRSREIGNDR